MITWNCARPFQHEAIFASVWPANKMIHPHFFLSTNITPVIQHTRISGMHWTCYSTATLCALQCHMMPTHRSVNSQKTAHGINQRMTVMPQGLVDVRYWLSCFTTKVGSQQSWWPNVINSTVINNLVYCIVYNIVCNTNLKLSWSGVVVHNVY